MRELWSPVNPFGAQMQDSVQDGRRRRACAVDPGAELLRSRQIVGEVADAGDSQVLDGAGGRAADACGDLSGAPLGDDDTRRAGALGDTADSAEVLGVVNLVERYDDCVVVALEQAGCIGIPVWLHLSADALVVGGAAQRRQLLVGRENGVDVLRGGSGGPQALDAARAA